MSRKLIFLCSPALALLLLLGGAATALAANVPVADVGQNIGNLLSQWGKWLLIPTAGLFGLAALFKRDVGHALTIAVIAIVVGIFVYDQSGATSMINSIATTITK